MICMKKVISVCGASAERFSSRPIFFFGLQIHIRLSGVVIRRYQSLTVTKLRLYAREEIPDGIRQFLVSHFWISTHIYVLLMQYL